MNLGGPNIFSISAGQTKHISSDRNLFNIYLSVPKKGGSEFEYKPKRENGKTINPLKGLTIKTVNGKVVIVENQ